VDILNTREWAIVIWVTGFFGYLFISPRMGEVRKSFRNVIKAFFARHIITIMSLMTLYVLSCLYILSQIDLWEWNQSKNTIIWFVAVGALSLLKLNSIKQDEHFFRNSVLDNLKLVGIIEFVVGLNTFNIVVELLLFPFLLLLGAMLGIAQSNKEHRVVEKLINGVLVFVGSIIVAYAIYMIFSDFDKFAQTKTLHDFYIPPLLSLVYMPFIFFMLVYISYETVFIRLLFSIKNRPIRIYSKLCAIILFNVRMKLLDRWASSLSFINVDSISDVNQSFKQIFKLVSVEKNPPKVNGNDGWSPYDAKNFLINEGVKTGYYHPGYSKEWFASSDMIEIEGGLLANNISYYIDGNESIAKSLKLMLNVNSPSEATSAHKKLLLFARKLCSKATNYDLHSPIEKAIKEGESILFDIENYSFSIERQDWENHQFGGYDVKFIITSTQRIRIDHVRNEPRSNPDCWTSPR